MSADDFINLCSRDDLYQLRKSNGSPAPAHFKEMVDELNTIIAGLESNLDEDNNNVKMKINELLDKINLMITP